MKLLAIGFLAFACSIAGCSRPSSSTPELSQEPAPRGAYGVQLRLLDREGDPVRDQRVGLELQSEGRKSYKVSSVTDSNGCLDQLLNSGLGIFDTLWVVTEQDSALVLLDVEERISAADIGDVRLGTGPEWATGRVHDEDGAPVSHAIVHLVDVNGRNCSRPYRSDREGFFRILGDRRPRGVRAIAKSPGYACPDSVWMDPDEETEIRLTTSGSIAVSLDSSKLGSMDSRLGARWTLDRLPDGSSPSGYAARAKHIGTHQAVVNDLLPGSYTLRLSLTSRDEPDFLRIPGVQVRAGETCFDWRVQEIDLGRFLDVVQVTVVDDKGKAAPNATLEVDGRRVWKRQPNGVFRIARIQGDSLRLVIDTADDEPVERNDVRDDLHVVMTSKLRARFRVAGVSSHPLHLFLNAEFQRADDPNAPIVRTAGDFDAWTGRTVAFFDEPGRYDVFWSVRSDVDEYRRISTEPFTTLEIERTSEERWVDLRLEDRFWRRVERVATSR